jgi:HlyD family secretion protein
MKRKVIILVLLVVVGLGATVAFRSGWFRHGDPNHIHISGNIELTEVDISFKVPGKLIERAVDEGAWVKKGQLIGRIDRDQFERQRSRDQAGVVSAETQFDQSRSSVAFQKATLVDDVEMKRAQLRAAESHLEELVTGSRPQEIQQAQAGVADAKAQYEQAKLDWDRAQTLFKNDDISKAQFDQYRARFDSTSANLRNSEEHLSLAVEGTRKEEIQYARDQVAVAQAALRLSEANRIEVQRREQDLAMRRAEIERAKQQVGITDTQLNDTLAYSPVDGVVLVKSAEVGEVLAAGTTVVTIGDLDHPWLRGYINEPDLGRIKQGMHAKVTTDSFPGKAYDGRISFIASDAEFTPKQIQTEEERVKLVYRIKIEIANPEHELKSNMPVEAVIDLNP